MEKNKVQRKEIIIAAFVLVGFVAISLVCAHIVFDPLRLQPTTVSQAFIKALIHRNKTKAYRLSSPDLWDDIDKWYMNEANGPTECPLIATINEDYFGAGVCDGGRKDTTVSCSWWQVCRPINYEFKINDVEVIRKGLSWQVIDFGPICESWDYECLY